ncbi:MAG: hypothetical protein Alpg2KO_26310 [Alphaproteobacteria bacterium]
MLDQRGASSSSGTLRDPLVRLANEDGNIIGSNDDGGSLLDASLIFTVDETATYYAVASSYAGAGIGTYTLELSTFEDDYAGDTSTTGRISVNQDVTGELYAGDNDWFRIELAAGQEVVIEVLGADNNGGTLTDPYLTVRDDEGEYITHNDDRDFPSDFDPYLTFEAQETGVFFLDVRAWSSAQTGSYTLRVTGENTPPEADDGQFAVDYNGNLAGNLANLVEDDGPGLSFEVIEQTENGELTLSSNGVFSYAPDINYSGGDSFRYRVTDTSGETDTATVSIIVSDQGNSVPVASTGEFTGNEDQIYSGSLIDLVSDADNDDLTFRLASSATHGTAIIDADGSFRYEPNDEFSGQDVFRYAVSDGQFSVTGIVFMTVDPVNDAPEADDDAFSMEEDKSLTATVVSNDGDIDSPNLTWSLQSGPSEGQLTFEADGSFIYTPDEDYFGQDSFVYILSDGDITDTATVSITVSEVNDTPEPTPDSYTGIEEGDPVTGNVLDNDSDEEGDDLTASLVLPADNGRVVLNEDGTFTYTPNEDFAGEDIFSYAVSDGQTSATATVTIQITNTPDAPEANDDEYRAQEARTLEANVGDNDVDPDPGAELTFGLLSGVSHGVLNFNADGSFTYLNTPDYRGTDTFRYRVTDGDFSDTATVTLNVTDQNDAPIINGEQITIDEDETVQGNVLDNDSDPDGDPLSVTLIGNVENGRLSLRSDGQFTYTPDRDFAGADSFTYRVSDGDMTGTATVSITIRAVDDAPDTEPGRFNAVEDTMFIDTLADLAEDAEGANLTFSLASPGDHGDVRIDSSGTFAYIPDADFFGTDTFQYQVSDGGITSTGTVTMVVRGVNDAPVAFDDLLTGTEDTRLQANVLDNDEDPDTNQTLTVSLLEDVSHGTLLLTADGRVFYDPDANYSGMDRFTYQITDGFTTSSADAVIEVRATNDAPVAGSGAFAGTEDDRMVETLTELVRDVDGDDLIFSLGTEAEHGEVTVDAGGTFVYRPDADYNGPDSFHYKVSDGSVTSTGSVSLSIGADNDAPVVLDEQFETPESVELRGNVATNDSDIDGDDLSFEVLRNVDHGRLVLNEDGSFTYTPNGEFQGEDVFTYAVHDGEATVTGQATIVVTSPPDDPSSDRQGDSPEDAGEIIVDQSRAARINFGGDRDWFGLTVSAGGKYLIEVLGVSSEGGSLLDPQLAIYDAEGNLLDQNDDDGTGFDPELIYTAEDNGTIYVEVSEFGGDDPGSYTLQVTGSDWRGSDSGDSFRAGSRADELRGRKGHDTIYAGDGEDEVIGGTGRDTLFGEDGNDTVRGNKGDDLLVGGKGDDFLSGGAHEDLIKGNGGDDVLEGNNGADRLEGGSGNDSLSGGRHTDVLVGGDGADTFIFSNRNHSSSSTLKGRDVIEDFNASEGDAIDLSGLSGSSGFTIVDSASGVAGEIWLEGGRMRIDLDGDGTADMQIVLPGVDALDMDWIIT